MLERSGLDHFMALAAEHVCVRREGFTAGAHYEHDLRDIRTTHRGDRVGGVVLIVNEKI
jgi:hypothetical protein